MSRPRRRFRFTIAQGMAVIAALGVTFAIFPMPLAIAFLVFAGSLLLLRPDPRSRRTPHGASLGCLFGLLGCPAGAIIGVHLAGHRVVMDRFSGVGDPTALGALLGGLVGALAAGLAGYFVSRALFRGLMNGRAPRNSPREALREEIGLVDGLLRHAREQADEEVTVKLAEYKVKLERDLERLPIAPEAGLGVLDPASGDRRVRDGVHGTDAARE